MTVKYQTFKYIPVNIVLVLGRNMSNILLPCKLTVGVFEFDLKVVMSLFFAYVLVWE